MPTQPLYLPSTYAHTTPHVYQPPLTMLPPPAPPNPRILKLQSQISTLSSTIQTTQTSLTSALLQITELESFKSKHPSVPTKSLNPGVVSTLDAIESRTATNASSSHSPLLTSTKTAAEPIPTSSHTNPPTTTTNSFPSSNPTITKTNPPATPTLSPDTKSSAEAHAKSILDRHIKLLHRYNEIKDIAMGMLGIIADREGKTLRDVMESRSVSDGD